MTELLKGFVESVTPKVGGEGNKKWKRVSYKINGKIHARFENGNIDNNETDFIVGDHVAYTITQNGKYSNIETIQLAPESNVDVNVEEVIDNSEKVPAKEKPTFVDPNVLRRKEITLGQAMNLALSHLHENPSACAPEVFDQMFKQETHRFFKLAQELQEELLQ